MEATDAFGRKDLLSSAASNRDSHEARFRASRNIVK